MLDGYFAPKSQAIENEVYLQDITYLILAISLLLRQVNIVEVDEQIYIST